MLKRVESIVNGGGNVMTLKNVVSTSGEAQQWHKVLLLCVDHSQHYCCMCHRSEARHDLQIIDKDHLL